MCGLFGFVHIGAKKLRRAEIDAGRKALTSLSHRGPDQWSDYVDGGIYMGHRRLSILDLSESGRQPMVHKNGDIAVTANGEIYNFQNIRDDLGKENFQSSSDSEILVHGTQQWSMEKLIDRIDGMYAFVVLDKRHNSLHFVRDRTGIKPLLYGRVGDYFFWASELKAIRSFCQTMDLTLEIDNTALFDFLTYRYIPGEKTLYKQVHSLRPAHHLTVKPDNGAETKRCYWELPVGDAAVDHDSAAEQLRAFIATSVQEQLMGDVPVGFFLSGGIDSSIIVAEAADIHPDPATFSIGYDEKTHDETQYAELVAQHFKTRQRTEILSGDDAQDLFELLAGWYDQPFSDNSALSTFHVSRFAREHAIVALSGDGGDELFGGYRWYERFERYRKSQKHLNTLFGKGPGFSLAKNTTGLPNKLLSRFDLLSHFDPLEFYVALIGGLPPNRTKNWRDRLDIPADYDALWNFHRFYRPELPVRKRMQYLDFHTFLPDDILTKVDRVSMAVSLECRVPFLARDVVEYAFSLPEDFLYKDGVLKGGLKYAYRDVLPREITERGKKGFSIPLHKWAAAMLQKEGSLQEAVLNHFLLAQNKK